MAAFNDIETFVSVILLGDQEFLDLVFVRSPVSSRNKILLQLSVREKPKVVRSLQQCAPLWPIGELNFFFCLTPSILTIL